MNQPPIFKLLNDLLILALREDDFITVPQHIAFCVTEYDKEERLYHVESPSQSNNKYQLWHIKAWRATLDNRARVIARAKADQLAFDNLKLNLRAILKKLKEVTKLTDEETLSYMSVELLKNNPDDLSMIGILLVEPYYRGIYTIIPFKER